MNHLPFEEWMLKEEKLTRTQERELAAHLQECRYCTALEEVNLALRSARQVEPARGFTSRFHARLADRKQALKRRSVLGFSLLAVSTLGVFTATTWTALQAVVESPLGAVSSWLTSLVGIWASLQAMFHAGLVLFRVAPAFVPGYIWTVLIFILSGWSLVWIYSLLKFTRIPQGV